MKFPNLHTFLERFSLQPGDAQVRPVFRKPRFPRTCFLSPSLRHALFAFPLPPLLLGENLLSALKPEHPEGLRWLFLQGHLLFLLIQQPSTIARNPSCNFKSQKFYKERASEFCILNTNGQGWQLTVLMPAFGFEEHPVYTWHTILPPAVWLGCLFSQPEHKHLETGNAPYLALPGCAGTW